jgi:hypothetical protein
MSEPIKPLDFSPQSGGRVHFLLPSDERVGFRMYLQERHSIRADLVRQRMLAGYDELFFRISPGAPPAQLRETCDRVQDAYREWRARKSSK